jgi:hypothetical protein
MRLAPSSRVSKYFYGVFFYERLPLGLRLQEELRLQEDKCPQHPPPSFATVYSANIMLEKASIENSAETRAIKTFADSRYAKITIINIRCCENLPDF